MATTVINNKGFEIEQPQPPRQIRFVNNQGQPPSKRRRITAACLTCRRRKTRCAGERPQCSTCTKNGHNCLGYPEDKKDETDTGDARADDLDDRNEIEESIEEEDKNPRKCNNVTGNPSRGGQAPPSPPPPRLRQQASTVSPTMPHKLSTSPQLPPAPPPAPSSQPPQHHYIHTQRSQSDEPGSPSMHHILNPSHRVPYFRYFGPTAIVPGFKQMVVSVRDRRRSTNGSHSGTSPISNPSGGVCNGSAAESDVAAEDLPVYDPNDPAPVHPFILSLAKTFFLHMGCNYPFLQERNFMRMLEAKRVEPILVDAVCALAARFSDSAYVTGGNDKVPRTERGQAYAQRAKHATVDTFPCPSVSAVQACLLMAYEGFGADQDSALWMYLGLAIRMAIDLGLQKRVGVQYQGENDPWNTQNRPKNPFGLQTPEETKAPVKASPSEVELKELEQERMDTFWAAFVLDRFISSGTGRPVTLRDDDYDLQVPRLELLPGTQWPNPFPVFLEIIHLYGRVSDVLNNINDLSDLTREKWQKLNTLESKLTRVYKSWDSHLQFNVINFKMYLGAGHGTTFILLHFWFHALFIVLHQPTLLTPFGDLRSDLQLLPDSRELSMSSAKTICDILAFADLIDPSSFIGNPFTSQPIYIAACAFLMESSASVSEGSSRDVSPPLRNRASQSSGANMSNSNKTANGSKKSRHSLLASAANQNYQQCYRSLEHLQRYWGGCKYILTALDQKAKGIWDCETFTSEEYASIKPEQQTVPMGSHLRFEAPPSDPNAVAPPIAWSLAGTANSPNSSLTVMYQKPQSHAGPSSSQQPKPGHKASHSNPINNNMRQAPHDATGMYPPPIPQMHPPAPINGSPDQDIAQSSRDGRPSVVKFNGLPEETERENMYTTSHQYASSSQHSAAIDSYEASSSQTMPGATHQVHPHGQQMYYPHGMPYPGAWVTGTGNMEAFTFDSQDIDIGALGIEQPGLMGPWMDYIPEDVLGLLDHHDMGQGDQGGP